MLPAVDSPAGFAVRYEPAVLPLEVGGDWHDVLPVDDHCIGVIVGDCVGRGLPAAAVMGQLRSSARALLLTGAQPATLLEQLDSVAALIPGAFCTTVFVAIIDTESGVLRYSNAGHPPAVLAAPQADVTYLTDAHSVPLAVHRDGPRPQWSQRIPAGSTLILYTDGLVERRDVPIDRGIARVGEVLVQTAGLSADEVAEKMLRELAPPNGYDDDVAIVVCQTSHSPLRIENLATADRLNGIRQRLADWLRASAVPEDRIDDIVLGVNEACSNSAEHAYRGRTPGTMTVDATRLDDDVLVTVADAGEWHAPPENPGFRGRGLPLIRAVSDHAEFECTPTGTTVEMTFRLRPTER
jgi:anti-sigma regulatory factor (Ser/Thr protein kinase)